MTTSPIKKINFEAVGKENIARDAPVVDDLELKKPVPEVAKQEDKKPVMAPTIKKEEANEPLLQENPHRFVLFPIRYHEVCCPPRVTRKVVRGNNADKLPDLADV